METPTLPTDMYFVLEDNPVKEPVDIPKPAPRRQKSSPNQLNKSGKLADSPDGLASRQDDLHTSETFDKKNVLVTEGKKLEHLSKNRPKRANVKKPTRNPEKSSNKIETVELRESLESKEDASMSSSDAFKTKPEPSQNHNPLVSSVLHNEGDSVIHTPKSTKLHNIFTPPSTQASKVEQPKIR
jgi:hypothetical protein